MSAPRRSSRARKAPVDPYARALETEDAKRHAPRKAAAKPAPKKKKAAAAKPKKAAAKPKPKKAAAKPKPKPKKKAVKRKAADSDSDSDSDAAPPAKKKAKAAPTTIKEKRDDEAWGLTIPALKDILRSNFQVVGGTKDEVAARVVDGATNGGLPKCPHCFVGNLKPTSKGRFFCKGAYDDDHFVRCNRYTKEGDFERLPWTYTTASGLL